MAAPLTNEQTNALLRRWLPKGSDLNLNPAHLAVIADNLNEMPRKPHNWKSAADIYTQLSQPPLEFAQSFPRLLRSQKVRDWIVGRQQPRKRQTGETDKVVVLLWMRLSLP
ncbi:MAG: hypothetical protein F4Y27_01585 [Acidimicrobiaceae bacterium]|nr:hypothetical protein [Acidimicrobiaceae bacterium]MYA73359.1 hypothetical protein [Acidimicrobiaceae bacterium]MYG54796.1 hypothetical protein [Acidimicrobiaceae bacterium]MYI59909.1 hypothetical protein [Acidimicrobiaceae bacterium]MYJ99194.1 hypothetical protein [Acidimicrobiaceae bacterium]